MKFKSKTELSEHIKELCDSGYLKSHWDLKHGEGKTRGIRVYTVNYDGVLTK